MEIRLKITYDTEFFIKSADGSHSDDNAKLLKTINAQLKKKTRLSTEQYRRFI